MTNESTVDSPVAFAASDVQELASSAAWVSRLKGIPWTRVLVDALLVASVLLASSSLLTVR
ncbi:MAG: hypothetical protein ABSH50_09305 [Bryobacteraceae bacterium]